MTEQDRRARAADYVLGLMNEDERERAERDLERDDAFRDMVFSLAQEFHKLDMTASPEPVPHQLWARISDQIAEMPQIKAAPVNETGEKTVLPGGSMTRVGPQSFAGWRGALMAACLVAACGLGYVGGTMTAATREPVVVVVLDTPQNTPGAIFEAYSDDSVRIIPLEAFTVPQNHTMQVWTLYDKDVGPVSLGTIPAAKEVRLKGPHLPMPKAEQLYEITLEPAPGSPTGKPTGPILVKGFAKRPAG